MAFEPRKFPPKNASTPAPTTKTTPSKGGGADKPKNPDRLGAAWLAESKAGMQYIKVKLDDGTEMVLFPNDKKEKDSQPDFNVMKKKAQT